MTNFSRWLAQIEDTPGVSTSRWTAIKNIRGILENYQEAEEGEKKTWNSRSRKKMTENETPHCLWTGHTLESEITITAKRPLSVKSII